MEGKVRVTKNFIVQITDRRIESKVVGALEVVSGAYPLQGFLLGDEV